MSINDPRRDLRAQGPELRRPAAADADEFVCEIKGRGYRQRDGQWGVGFHGSLRKQGRSVPTRTDEFAAATERRGSHRRGHGGRTGVRFGLQQEDSKHGTCRGTGEHHGAPQGGRCVAERKRATRSTYRTMDACSTERPFHTRCCGKPATRPWGTPVAA